MHIGKFKQVISSVAALLLWLPALPAAAQPLEAAPAPSPAAQIREYDREGIRRDTLYFVGYQAAAAGVILLWPQDETDPPVNFDAWWHNVSHPRWDPDRAVVNYVLHPYWGAAYYIRARERGLDRSQAFWYSVLLSTIFEYSAEALLEPVSYQDLVVTPVLGSLLGEYVFAPLRERILSQSAPLSAGDQLLLVLTDPLDAINSAVGRVFGIETELSAGPLLPRDGWNRRSVADGMPAPHAGHRAAAPAGWGLQLRASW